MSNPFEDMFPVDERLHEEVKHQGKDLTDALEILTRAIGEIGNQEKFIVWLLIRLQKMERQQRTINEALLRHIHSSVTGLATVEVSLLDKHYNDCIPAIEFNPNHTLTAVGPDSDLQVAVQEMTSLLCSINKENALTIQEEIIKKKRRRTISRAKEKQENEAPKNNDA